MTATHLPQAPITSRYALYWAPATESALAAIGRDWLGRDTEGRTVKHRQQMSGFESFQLEALTAEPRRYGLHATLKPPFALAEGTSLDDLDRELTSFASSMAPVQMPALRLSRLGRFLAATPSAPCSALDTLAARCVTDFDRFRRPLLPAELARRASTGLDPIETAHLQRWGYPYVLDRFRFHVTLTGPLDDTEREGLAPQLAALLEPALGQAFQLTDIALFEEVTPGAPFKLVKRFRLDRT